MPQAIRTENRKLFRRGLLEMLRRKPAIFHQLFNERRRVLRNRPGFQLPPANSEVIPISAGGTQRGPPECRFNVELAAVIDEKLNDFLRSTLSGPMNRR